MNIHDSGYKVLFSNRTIFRQLLESFVSEEWVKDVDFDNCERLDKSFISEHYKETESDLIYKVKLKQELLRVFEKEDDKTAISLFLNWFFQLKERGRPPERDYGILARAYASKEEVQTMLITALEKERKELKKQMKRELEAEMKNELEKRIKRKLEKKFYEKAKLEEQIDMAKKMLVRGFEANVISELTGLPQPEILKLKTAIANS